MIVFIVIIAVFVNKAGELGLNKFKWGAIGLAAYFLTQVAAGIILSLTVDLMGGDLAGTEIGLNLIGVLVGLVCVIIAYQQMPKYALKETNSANEDLLDDEMLR